MIKGSINKKAAKYQIELQNMLPFITAAFQQRNLKYFRAMKWIPEEFRERMTHWFGKNGIPWVKRIQEFSN